MRPEEPLPDQLRLFGRRWWLQVSEAPTRVRHERDLQRRVAELRGHLKDALTRQVHLELEQSGGRINEAIGPYRRFVQTQQQQLNEARGELVATEDALLRLRADIEKR